MQNQPMPTTPAEAFAQLNARTAEQYIRAMAASGMGVHEIAALTGLRVVVVRRVLAKTEQR
jgi:hypothetical protein